jgi:hypothetical protein
MREICTVANYWCAHVELGGGGGYTPSTDRLATAADTDRVVPSVIVQHRDGWAGWATTGNSRSGTVSSGLPQRHLPIGTHVRELVLDAPVKLLPVFLLSGVVEAAGLKVLVALSSLLHPRITAAAASFSCGTCLVQR